LTHPPTFDSFRCERSRSFVRRVTALTGTASERQESASTLPRPPSPRCPRNVPVVQRRRQGIVVWGNPGTVGHPEGIVRRRVLVIEDNARDRELVKDLLEEAQCEVQVAEGGGLGLSLATTEPPDIILLDLHLPDMDGYEVCRLLRQDSRLQDVPIVIITASDDPALNRLAYEAGAQACVLKPVRPKALLITLEAAMAGMRRGKSS